MKKFIKNVAMVGVFYILAMVVCEVAKYGETVGVDIFNIAIIGIAVALVFTVIARFIKIKNEDK